MQQEAVDVVVRLDRVQPNEMGLGAICGNSENSDVGFADDRLGWLAGEPVVDAVEERSHGRSDAILIIMVDRARRKPDGESLPSFTNVLVSQSRLAARLESGAKQHDISSFVAKSSRGICHALLEDFELLASRSHLARFKVASAHAKSLRR